MRTSKCITCGMTILGERLRCPRCHEDHARMIAARPPREVLVRRIRAGVLVFDVVMLALVSAVYLAYRIGSSW